MPYPQPLEHLVACFERLPGVGRRTAERLAFHLLRDPGARGLSAAIDGALAQVRLCRVCFNVTEADPCAICTDTRRDGRILCVVEQPRDVEALERAGVFAGRYHVLMGALNPAEGTEERHLTLRGLLERVSAGELEEVILATDPDAEGEASAALVIEALEEQGCDGLRITRLARGMPAGSAIEYLHRGVLEDALEGRRPVRGRPRS